MTHSIYSALWLLFFLPRAVDAQLTAWQAWPAYSNHSGWAQHSRWLLLWYGKMNGSLKLGSVPSQRDDRLWRSPLTVKSAHGGTLGEDCLNNSVFRFFGVCFFITGRCMYNRNTSSPQLHYLPPQHAVSMLTALLVWVSGAGTTTSLPLSPHLARQRFKCDMAGGCEVLFPLYFSVFSGSCPRPGLGVAAGN